MNRLQISRDHVASTIDDAIRNRLTDEQKEAYSRSAPLKDLGLNKDDLGSLVADLCHIFNVQGLPNVFTEHGNAHAIIQYIVEAKIEVFKDYLYEAEWIPSPLTETQPLKPGGLWLIIGSNPALQSHLHDVLLKAGQRSIPITWGDQFLSDQGNRFEVDPRSPSWFARVCKEIPQLATLTGVVFCYEHHGSQVKPSYQDIEETLAKTCNGFMHLVTALTAALPSPSAKLWLVGRGAAKQDSVAHLVSGSLAALCGTAAAEYPVLQFSHLRLESDQEVAASVNEILSELSSKEDEPEVLWRSGQRHISRLRFVETTAVFLPSFPEQSSYLIMGGLRPLGLEVARWYAKHGARSLILLDEFPATEEIQAEIASLESSGLTIKRHICRFDDATSLAQLFAEIKVELPPLKGLVHCAGVIEQDILLHLNWKRFEEANRQKIAGSWNLHLLTADLDLDHFTLFSTSLVELDPSARGAYIVGNGFLNTLASFRRTLGLPSLAIDWGPWVPGKMRVAHMTETMLASPLRLQTPADGLGYLEGIFYHPSPRVMAAHIDWESYFRREYRASPLLIEIKHEVERRRDSLLDSINSPIAIIGMGCRFPGGGFDPEHFWQLLHMGGDAVVDVPKSRWSIDEYFDEKQDTPGKVYVRKAAFLQEPIDEFDPAYFGISPRETEELDPQQRLSLEVAVEALEDAAIPTASLKSSKTGVYMGAFFDDYSRMITAGTTLEDIGKYYCSGNLFSALSGRISYYLGLNGPSIALDTACSSSLVTIDAAVKDLRSGRCDLALAGGVNLMLSPLSTVACCRPGMLSPDGHSKTFDAGANGYARGEGCGIVVLKRLKDAQKDNDRIQAVIKGTAVNHGGTTAGLTVPSGPGQVDVIRSALQDARVEATDVAYVEAHGTGTSLGDPIEVSALMQAYVTERTPEWPLIIGSVKTNIGHTEAAAGIAGLIKVVLTLNHHEVPKHLHFKTLNPYIELDANLVVIPLTNTPLPTDRGLLLAGVSSFGFSGTNAHVIIQEAPAEKTRVDKSEDKEPHLLTLSAKSEAALQALVKKYVDFLSTTKSSLSDICYTSNIGRDHSRFRVAVTADTKADLASKLASGQFLKGEAKRGKPIALPIAENRRQLLDLVAQAYTSGGLIDWKQLHAQRQLRKVRLPTYAFQRSRYWLSITAQEKAPEPIAASIPPKLSQADYLTTALSTITGLPANAIHEHTELAGLGLDSLMLTELLNNLKRDLGVSLDLQSVQAESTLESLRNSISKQLESPADQRVATAEDTRQAGILRSSAEALYQLFLIPPLGFGQATFANWPKHLPKTIELIYLGHNFQGDWDEMIQQMAQTVRELATKPFVIYGHSLGGMVAYELASLLEQKLNLYPAALVISAVTPPTPFSRLKYMQPFCDLGADEGAVRELLIDSHYLPPVDMPIRLVCSAQIAADARAIASYSPKDRPPISSPIHLIQASHDVLIPDGSLHTGWINRTKGTFTYHEVEGSHLFVVNPPTDFFQLVVNALLPKKPDETPPDGLYQLEEFRVGNAIAHTFPYGKRPNGFLSLNQKAGIMASLFWNPHLSNAASPDHDAFMALVSGLTSYSAHYEMQSAHLHATLDVSLLPNLFGGTLAFQIVYENDRLVLSSLPTTESLPYHSMVWKRIAEPQRTMPVEGCWTLVSYKEDDRDVLGSDPKGSLMITESGHLVMTAASKDRENLRVHDLAYATDDELRQLVQSYRYMVCGCTPSAHSSQLSCALLSPSPYLPQFDLKYAHNGNELEIAYTLKRTQGDAIRVSSRWAIPPSAIR